MTPLFRKREKEMPENGEIPYKESKNEEIEHHRVRRHGMKYIMRKNRVLVYGIVIGISVAIPLIAFMTFPTLIATDTPTAGNNTTNTAPPATPPTAEDKELKVLNNIYWILIVLVINLACWNIGSDRRR